MLLVAIISVSAAAQTVEQINDEISASRKLIAALERENSALRERLETEQKANLVLIELNETRKAENESLRTTIAAKNETIEAKDAVIALQQTLAGSLKKDKTSIWKRLGDIAIGAAIGAILK